MDTGVIYVAYGRKAYSEASESITSLRNFHRWPILVIGDRPIKGHEHRTFTDRGTPGRWAKVNLNKLTKWKYTLFLDADTRIHQSLDFGFTLLRRGFDMVMVPSKPQHNDMLRHLSSEERRVTLAELPLDPLQLNTGVIWFGPGSAPLFELWREEWDRWKDKDQGALLRALYRHPVSIAILGRNYNARHGTIVEHRFGACN